MKIIYFLIVVVVIYLGVSYFRFKYVIAHANLPMIDQADRMLGSGPKFRYIAAGDSTAVGEGASSYKTSYAYRIAGYLAQTHTVEYRNIGVVGAKTADVMNEQLQKIISYNPDVITISIGANDVTHLISNSIILNNFKSILDQLQSQTHARIYITDIPDFSWADLLPWPYRRYLDYEIKPLNAQLLALENDRVKVIDIYHFGWSNYPDVSITNSADHFHPNDEGYNNWTKAFLSKIKVN